MYSRLSVRSVIIHGLVLDVVSLIYLSVLYWQWSSCFYYRMHGGFCDQDRRFCDHGGLFVISGRVKRVIAKGGDTVSIDYATGTVAVNGEVLQEDYIAGPTYLGYDVQFPYTVPESTVFVMGDNRNQSLDSRSTYVGCIDERDILGNSSIGISPHIHKSRPAKKLYQPHCPKYFRSMFLRRTNWKTAQFTQR